MSRTNKHWKRAKALSDQYFKILLGLVRLKTKDDELTREIVSAVFNKLYLNEELCEHIEDPAGAYLFRMAINEWLMMLRKAQRDEDKTAGYSLLQAAALQESPEDAFIIQEAKAQFDKLVHQLPTRMRDVFELLRASYTTREVSEMMGISEQTVLNTKSKAIKALRKELEKRGLLHLRWLLY